MSCGSRPRIVLTLLGVAACVPIATLPAFSQPGAASASLEPAARKTASSCHSTSPVLCIYANRDWVSHLEREVWATDRSAEPDSDETTELANSRQRSAADLGRKIRFLTQLKTWLDAIS